MPHGSLARGLWIVAAALAVPIIPFLLAGPPLEAYFQRLAEAADGPTFATIVASLLALDVLLPVPSSALGTLAGARLGLVGGAATSWLGMNAGALVAFLAARTLGQAALQRWIAPDDRQRMRHAAARHGWWLLIVARPLPILAEASVLWLAATGLAWRDFLWPVLLGNLALALAYAALGSAARAQQALWPALVISVLLPLAATYWARRRWLRSSPDHAAPAAAPASSANSEY